MRRIKVRFSTDSECPLIPQGQMLLIPESAALQLCIFRSRRDAAQDSETGSTRPAREVSSPVTVYTVKTGRREGRAEQSGTLNKTGPLACIRSCYSLLKTLYTSNPLKLKNKTKSRVTVRAAQDIRAWILLFLPGQLFIYSSSVCALSWSGWQWIWSFAWVMVHTDKS